MRLSLSLLWKGCKRLPYKDRKSPPIRWKCEALSDRADRRMRTSLTAWLCLCLVFLGLCSASYKGKTNLSGCISRIPVPHPFTSFGQWEASKGDGEHKEKTMRPFLFPSQGASPARSCLLCGFCAPRLGTPHCSSQYRTLPALASLSAAFLYKVYFLISSIYLTSSVHLIPFVSTNKIIRAENGEIWRNPAVQNKVSIQFLRILT